MDRFVTRVARPAAAEDRVAAVPDAFVPLLELKTRLLEAKVHKMRLFFHSYH